VFARCTNLPDKAVKMHIICKKLLLGRSFLRECVGGIRAMHRRTHPTRQSRNGLYARTPSHRPAPMKLQTGSAIYSDTKELQER
jgi:hypothetical protein